MSSRTSTTSRASLNKAGSRTSQKNNIDQLIKAIRESHTHSDVEHILQRKDGWRKAHSAKKCRPRNTSYEEDA
jgi:hypothetical protein